MNGASSLFSRVHNNLHVPAPRLVGIEPNPGPRTRRANGRQRPQASMVTIPRDCQFFPDHLVCSARTVVQQIVSGVVAQSLSFKMNSVNLFGPQVNYAGAFGSNVPAGLIYLLSSSAAAGSNAPYGAVTVRRVDVTARIVANGGEGSVNVVPAQLAITYSTSSSLSGLSASSFAEQRMAKVCTAPANTSSVTTLRNSANCHDVFGVSERVYRDDEDYWSGAATDPTKLAYLHSNISAMDGVSSLYYFVEYVFDILYEFRSLQSFSSTSPS